jgi:hypothetical protein
MILNEECLMSLEIDKLTEQYTLKIPEVLRVGLSSLSPDQRKRMNVKLMVAMAAVIHESRFNPENYLTSREIV